MVEGRARRIEVRRGEDGAYAVTLDQAAIKNAQEGLLL